MTILAMGPTLATDEFQFGEDGFIINGPAELPFFDITSVQGLDSAPARVQTAEREGADGGYVDADWETVRTVTIEGRLYADPNNLQFALDKLKADFAVGSGIKPLYFQTDGGARMVYGKGIGCQYNIDELRRVGSCEMSLQVMCEDPRIYSPELATGSTTLGTSVSSGRGYPKEYPFGYGGPGQQNGFIVNLAGNRPAPGIITIEGPVVNPKVIYDNTGSTLSFNYTMNVGDIITIDLANKAVLLNGSGNARHLMTVTGGWFMLEPGDNSFRFFGTQSPPTPLAQMSVSAQASWR